MLATPPPTSDHSQQQHQDWAIPSIVVSKHQQQHQQPPYNDLLHRANAAEGLALRLGDELDTTKQQLSIYKHQATTAQEQVIHSKEKQTKIDHLNQDLTSQLSLAKLEIRQLTKEAESCSQAQQKVTKLRIVLEETKKECSAVRGKATSAEAEVVKLREMLERKELMMKKLHSQLKVYKDNGEGEDGGGVSCCMHQHPLVKQLNQSSTTTIAAAAAAAKKQTLQQQQQQQLLDKLKAQHGTIVAEYEENVRLAREENTKAQQALSEAQTHAANLQAEIAALQSQIGALTLRLEMSEEAKEAAAAAAATAISERDEVEKKTEEMRYRLGEREGWAGELQRQLEAATAGAAVAQAAALKKNKALSNELGAKIHELQDQLATEHTKLQSIMAMKEEEIHRLKQQDWETQQLLKEAQQAAAEASNQVEQLEKELEMSKNAAEKVHSELEEVKEVIPVDEQVTAVRRQLATKQSELDQLAAICQQADATIASCMNTIQQKSDEIQSGEASLQAMEVSLLERQDECLKTQAECDALKRELQEMEGRNASLEVHLKAANDRLEASQEDVKSTLTELQHAQHDQRQLQNTAARATLQLDTLTAELNIAKNEIFALKGSGSSTQHQLEQCITQLNIAERTAADAARAKLVLEDTFAQLQQERGSLLIKLEISEKARVEVTGLYEQGRQQVALLQREMETVRCRLSDAEVAARVYQEENVVERRRSEQLQDLLVETREQQFLSDSSGGGGGGGSGGGSHQYSQQPQEQQQGGEPSAAVVCQPSSLNGHGEVERDVFDDDDDEEEEEEEREEEREKRKTEHPPATSTTLEEVAPSTSSSLLWRQKCELLQGRVSQAETIFSGYQSIEATNQQLVALHEASEAEKAVLVAKLEEIAAKSVEISMYGGNVLLQEEGRVEELHRLLEQEKMARRAVEDDFKELVLSMD
jgi:chromosome segregation ATPase